MAANPIDLTTVAECKIALGIKPDNTADDDKLQSLITGASQYWLNRTLRGSLNSVVSYTEHYDGKGRDSLMLRYYPIISVQSLVIGGIPIPQSTDYITPGWIISDTKDQIQLVGFTYYFPRGRRNVAVQYSAGFPNGVSFDVREAVTKQVLINYKRQKNIDMASLALPEGGGTTSWRSWEVPPEVERVINLYSPGVPI